MASWREAHRERVLALEAEAAEVLLAALGSILDRAAARLGAVTAAAGDQAATAGESVASVDDLNVILSDWRAAVDNVVLPYFGGIFEAGADAAADQVAGIGVVVPAADPDFIDNAAAQYLAATRDRFYGLGDDTWNKARAELLAGFRAGEGIGELRARVQAVTDLSRAAAEALARTEVIGASNMGADARIALLGADAPPYKQWLSTLDTRTRPTHVRADGQVVPRTQQFVVGGHRLRVPGDPTGPPGEVMNCRCTVLYLDDDQPINADGRQEGGVDLAPTRAPEPTPAPAAEGPFQPLEFKPPKGYTTNDLVQYYIRSEFEPAFEQLTTAQRTAVRRYTSAGYKAMNRELRRGDPSESVARSVANLDDVFDSPVAQLPDDLVLYRGVKGRFADMLGKAHDSKQLVGSTMDDPGYMSTSLTRNTTGSFGRGGAVFHIEGRKGQRALGVPNGISDTFGENEVILPRGTRLEVTKSQRRSGTLHVFARIVEAAAT